MNINLCKVADLEDFRREIISLSGIPATYLGYADTVELRESLVHANISFATEIINQQELDNLSINKLIDIIGKTAGINYRPSEYVSVNLIPPSVLILQLIDMTIANVGNITQVFQQMQFKINNIMFLKQYIPFVDWDSLEKQGILSQVEKKIEKDIGGEDAANDMMGGMM